MLKCNACGAVSGDFHILEAEGGPMPDRGVVAVRIKICNSCYFTAGKIAAAPQLCADILVPPSYNGLAATSPGRPPFAWFVRRAVSGLRASGTSPRPIRSAIRTRPGPHWPMAAVTTRPEPGSRVPRLR